MVKSKKLNQTYKEYHNIYFFATKAKNEIPEHYKEQIGKVQREIEHFIRTEPQNAKMLQREIWGKEGELKFPIFIGNKSVCYYQEEYVLNRENKNYFDNQWITKLKDGVKGKIQRYIKMIASKFSSEEIIDEIMEQYQHKKPEMNEIYAFVVKQNETKRLSKQDSFLQFINPQLFSEIENLFSYVNKHRSVFSPTMCRADVFQSIKILAYNDDSVALRVPFFTDDVIYYKETKKLEGFQGELKWKTDRFIEFIREYNEIVNNLSIYTHPIFEETQNMFHYVEELEDVYPIYEKITILEKWIYVPEVLQTRQIKQRISLCDHYFKLEFPESACYDGFDFSAMKYKQVKKIAGKKEKGIIYPPVKEIKTRLTTYLERLIEKKGEGAETLPEEGSFYQPFGMNREELYWCFEFIKENNGKYGVTTFVEALCGDETSKMERYGLTSHPLFGSLKHRSYKKILALLLEMISLGFMIKIGDEYPKLYITEKGTQALLEFDLEKKKPLHQYKWRDGKEKIKDRFYTKEEKMLYLNSLLEEKGIGFFREILDLICEDTTYIKSVLPWVKQQYRAPMEPIFDLYKETKKKNHVLKLLSEIQKGEECYDGKNVG